MRSKITNDKMWVCLYLLRRYYATLSSSEGCLVEVVEGKNFDIDCIQACYENALGGSDALGEVISRMLLEMQDAERGIICYVWSRENDEVKAILKK